MEEDFCWEEVKEFKLVGERSGLFGGFVVLGRRIGRKSTCAVRKVG